jgi:hydroxymethylpyrimidine pyrophosphatase-like HAD family hydrolase
MSVEPEILPDVKARIASFLPEELTVVQTAPFYLEIIPSVINKGQGVLDTCGALGIAPSETIAFRDAENDIPMLRAAGIGVAMANATACVKAAADHVTLSNNEDGIAAALAHFLK